jgi:hypothetical protein
MREQFADEDGAAAGFKVRARRANPVTPASGNNWDLVEYDGDPDVLNARYGLPAFPSTLGWQSRRGPHRVFLTPPGETPMKFQIDDDGVVASTDGYLASAPSWRAEYDFVYRLNGTTEVVQTPRDLRDQLIALGRATRAETRRRRANGQPLRKGERNNGVFWVAVEGLRDGKEPHVVLEEVLDEARRAETAARP